MDLLTLFENLVYAAATAGMRFEVCIRQGYEVLELNDESAAEFFGTTPKDAREWRTGRCHPAHCTQYLVPLRAEVEKRLREQLYKAKRTAWEHLEVV